MEIGDIVTMNDLSNYSGVQGKITKINGTGVIVSLKNGLTIQTHLQLCNK